MPTFAEWSVRAGWRLQHEAADVVQSLLAGRADAGRRAWRLLLTTAGESAAGAAMLARDEETRAAWVELRNKVEAFRTFEHVDALIGARGGDRPIAELAWRAGRLAPPLSVWATEGVGYQATADGCCQRLPPRNLLVDAAVPPAALIPLHAGMGSAFAAHVIDGVRSDPEAMPMDRAVAEFDALCAANADGAHLDVAVEALGFVGRGMYEDLFACLDNAVRTTCPNLVPLVWHGAGRAVYFAPSSALPLAATRQRVLDDLVGVAPGAIECANAVAGFAWAVTLVNLRDPVVVEPFAEQAYRLGVDRPFEAGVGDAVEVWRRCAPEDPAADAFRARLPHASGTRAALRAGDLFQVDGDARHV